MTNKNEQVPEKGHELVAKLIANPIEFAEHNELLHQFYQGFSIDVLSKLLRHSNEKVISVALFITDELANKAASVLSDIIPLTQHNNASIRRLAYGALTGCITVDSKEYYMYIVLGIRDSDLSCRKLVILLMMRAKEIWLRAALDALNNTSQNEDLRKGLQMLLSETGLDASKVEAWIQDNSASIRRFGVIAAGRLADAYPYSLELAAQNEDIEIRECATAHMHFRELMRKRQKK